MSATDIKLGTNFGMTRVHVLGEKQDPSFTFGWKDAYRTLCGRSITAYSPDDEGIPSQIKGVDLSSLKPCTACHKKAGLS